MSLDTSFSRSGSNRRQPSWRLSSRRRELTLKSVLSPPPPRLPRDTQRRALQLLRRNLSWSSSPKFRARWLPLWESDRFNKLNFFVTSRRPRLLVNDRKTCICYPHMILPCPSFVFLFSVLSNDVTIQVALLYALTTTPQSLRSIFMFFRPLPSTFFLLWFVRFDHAQIVVPINHYNTTVDVKLENKLYREFIHEINCSEQASAERLPRTLPKGRVKRQTQSTQKRFAYKS